MQVVVQADVDRVQVVTLQQFAEIRVGVGDLELVGHAREFSFVNVRSRYQFRIRDIRIGLQVVFADLVADQVRAGARVLGTVTNDGWYGDSSAPPQHFAQAVLRAAESRRWLVRAALTGISGVIDPRGRVVARLEVGQSGQLVAEVVPAEDLTPRVRWGDWWAVVCVAATVVLVVSRSSRFRTVCSSRYLVSVWSRNSPEKM